MKNEFVPYDIALAMKELGFDEPCFGFYSLHKANEAVGGNYPCDGTNSAPLYQQAFRWFREKYDLNPSIMYNGVGQWDYTLGGVWSGRIWDSYEEAELACLNKLIEIVESKSE